jgi:hypothetical protein
MKAAEIGILKQAKRSFMKSLTLLMGVFGIFEHYYQLSGDRHFFWLGRLVFYSF